MRFIRTECVQHHHQVGSGQGDGGDLSDQHSSIPSYACLNLSKLGNTNNKQKERCNARLLGIMMRGGSCKHEIISSNRNGLLMEACMHACTIDPYWILHSTLLVLGSVQCNHRCSHCPPPVVFLLGYTIGACCCCCCCCCCCTYVRVRFLL